MRALSSHHHRFDWRASTEGAAFPAGLLLVLVAAIAFSMAMPWT
jgi:hypothetical protein